MTYTCTVAWCPFDGRSESAVRAHVRTVHPWLAARERAERVALSPFTRRALAGNLPAKVVR